MRESEMASIASLIARCLKNPEDTANLEAVKREVVELTKRFPIHV
jgi:glycine/serine hydroxymethyltransferase